eukprot:926-Heterococcus_DN1.PRE.1
MQLTTATAIAAAAIATLWNAVGRGECLTAQVQPPVIVWAVCCVRARVVSEHTRHPHCARWLLHGTVVVVVAVVAGTAVSGTATDASTSIDVSITVDASASEGCAAAVAAANVTSSG